MVQIKVTFDANLQQFVHHMKRAGGGRLRIIGDPSRERIHHMTTLGEYGVSLIKQRVARGVGSDDAPFKSLNERYRKWKLRVTGRGTRDLTFRGGMLASLSVRSVSETQVRFDITSQMGRVKAWTNEQRTPWWGWSPSDVKKLGTLFRQLFGRYQIANWGATLFGTRKPIWMNPAAEYAKSTRRVA